MADLGKTGGGGISGPGVGFSLDDQCILIFFLTPFFIMGSFLSWVGKPLPPSKWLRSNECIGYLFSHLLQKFQSLDQKIQLI